MLTYMAYLGLGLLTIFVIAVVIVVIYGVVKILRDE